jgi:nucleotide-binding universal stress UspA family protein
MIRRILVPLDGSALAESVLPAAQTFSRLAGASLILLQVVEPVEDFLGLDVQAPKTAAAQAYLDGIAERLASAGVTTLTRVAVGPAAEQILLAARDADLIALATHGRSGIGRWVFGTVAGTIVQHAPVPVLLVRARHDGAGSSGPPRRLLVPLDGSTLAEQALPPATTIARLAGAELVLMHATDWVRTVAGASADLTGMPPRDLVALADEQARAYLEGIGQRLAEQGVTVHVDTRLDPAAEAILTCAADRQADLIAMTTHGRSGLGRWLHGSTADRVLRASPIPVLLIRVGTPTGPAAESPSLSTSC